jgi:AcrR family transcriptional regulator
MLKRIVKERTVRRSEILDSAGRLIRSKGYEQMTVQDILDDLRIAKGTFYHYFGSKLALLEAFIERMLGDVDQLVGPIVSDPGLPALKKLQQLFGEIARWKTEQKTVLIALLRIWYTDDNVIVRHKLRATGLKRFAPYLAAIVRQGIAEGVMSTPYPEQAAEIVILIGRGLDDALAEYLLLDDPAIETSERIECTIAAYTAAVETILGIPPNSLHFVDTETLDQWRAST